MKNPHGVEPTHFMIKDTSKAIYCHPFDGPIFGDKELNIYVYCQFEYVNFIQCKGTYDCNDSSLFIGGLQSSDPVNFLVLDLEVYSTK